MWVANYVEEFDNVRPAAQILKDLDLAANLLLLHWLQNLNDTSFLIDDVDSFENFTVLSTTDFSDYFIILLIAESNSE